MTTPRATGIGGVFLRADDPGRLGEWYRRHLGIDVQEGGWALFKWRERDDAARPGATVWAVLPRDSDYFGRREQQAMVNYRVADLDAVLGALRSEGVQVDARLEETAEGRFGWAVDPEGNRIELWQPPEGR